MRSQRHRSTVVLLGLVAAVCLSRSSEGATHADSVTAALRSAAESGTLTGLRWPRFPHYRDELDAIYSGSGWLPVWSTNDRPTPAARTAVDMLLASKQRALEPDDYDAELLDRRLRELIATRSPSARDVAWFDAALTVDFARHLSAVRVGRVVPKHLAVGINVEPKRLDLAREIRTALANGRVADVVRDASRGSFSTAI
jgi:murein L,D-transpeptidase YcbB/YkuD